MHTLFIYALIIFAFVTIRLIVPARMPWMVKIALGLLVLLVALFHLWIRLFFGNLASPEMPLPMMLIFSWLFVALVLLFLLTVARDIIAILLWLSRRLGAGLRLPLSASGQAAVLAVLALLLAGYGLMQAMAVPEIRDVEARIKNLPPALDGVNIVQVADLHATAVLDGERVRAITDKINALRPDIIVFTGDNVDGSIEERREDVRPLKDLRAKYGIYGCLGNHEYYSDYEGWRKIFAELGITMLENSHVTLTINGQPLVLAGVTDPVARRFGLPEPDIDQALAGAPADAVTILLAHQTRNSADYARHGGVDVQLAGHTHGGLIMGMRWLVALGNLGFVSGWYQVEDMQVYVSPGAGQWNGFLVRLGVNSEISNIILRRAD